MSERDADDAPDTVEQRLDDSGDFEGPMTVREPPRHAVRSRNPTEQGMPALSPSGKPRVATKTTAGMPAMAPILAPRVHFSSDGTPPDGPTAPDGLPSLDASWEGPTDPEPTPTLIDSDIPRLPKPQVPAPNAPKVLLSPTMEVDAIRAEEAAHLRRQHKAREKREGRRSKAPKAGLPTEVLPAVQRRREKETKKRSDLPLVLGLVVLALLIFGVVGTLAWISAHPARPAVQAPR